MLGSEFTAFNTPDEATGTWESRGPGFSHVLDFPKIQDFQQFV